MDDFEPLDKQEDDNNEQWAVVDEQKEIMNNRFYLIIFGVFIVGWGIKFFQSLPSSNQVQLNEINNRRVELIESVQQSDDTAFIEAAAVEYDSLSAVVEELEGQ